MRGFYTWVGLAIASLLSACSTTPALPKIVAQNIAPPAGASASARIMALSVVKTNIPLGKDFAVLEYSWFCKLASKIAWRGTELNITRAEYSESFTNVLSAANYRQPPATVGAFDAPNLDDLDLLVGATIEDVDLNMCVPFTGDPYFRMGFTGMAKGSVYMKIRWQLFSLSEKKVVFETTTEGSFKTDDVVDATGSTFLRKAFESNVNNFLATPGLIKELNKPAEPGAKT